MSKKILLLTASYGTGHISATKSIDKALKQMSTSCETKIIDFLNVKGEEKKKLTLFQRLYNYSMKHPRLWDGFFYFTNNRFSTNILKKFILRGSYEAAKEIISNFSPDVIVSSHPYWNFIIERYKEEVRNIHYICVVTDSYMIHDSWKYGPVDTYCVIDTDTKEVLEKDGLKNIMVTGFPVNPDLEVSVDRSKVLSEVGLEPKVNTIAITVGLGALSRFMEIIEYLSTKEGNFQLLLIVGKFEEIANRIKNLSFKVKKAVIGWTPKMIDYIRVADIMICKGGGAITSETLAAGNVIFIPVFVPGQERGNVYVVQKYKYGFYETDINKIKILLDKIISREIDLSLYKENIKKYFNKGSAVKIAKFVLENF